MNALFYCRGDDGRMLQAFTAAFGSLPGNHRLHDANDLPADFDHASIDSALVWQVRDDFFEKLSKLTHVYALAAGVDQLLQHPGLPDDVRIVRLEDAGMAAQMSEYVLYGVLRAQRYFHDYQNAQSHTSWVTDLPIRRAKDTRVGILGAGVLGSAVAIHLAANSYNISVWSRSAKTPRADVNHVHGQDALAPLLAQSDVLVCLLPLTDDTRGILNRSLFNQLPRGAFIINCARGPHLVDDDLLLAIDEGQLSGAMLDVFNQEPLPADHPFWPHPRIVVTPHVAAQTLIEDSVNQVIESIRTVQQGDLPSGMVDRSRGY